MIIAGDGAPSWRIMEGVGGCGALGLWSSGVRRSALWGAALWVVAGCATGAEDPPTTTVVLGDAGDDDDDGSMMPDDGATSTAGDGASGQVDDTGSADSTGGAGSTQGPADGGSDESSGGPPPVCPPEAGDTPCETCGKQNCCGEYLACNAEAECQCALECYLAGTPTEDCFVMCGATQTAFDLFLCAAGACADVCE